MVPPRKKQNRLDKTLDELLDQLQTSIKTVDALDKTVSRIQEQEAEFREHIRALGISKKLLKIAELLNYFKIKIQALYLKLKEWIFITHKTSNIFADPHATSDGHLDGAYEEGEAVETLLDNAGYSHSMKRHPVSKEDFLANLNRVIVHLAGHGSVSGNNVYFLFDDGNVFPGDIENASAVPTTLMYAGVCLGGSNDSMARVFIDRGTKYYVGFTTTIPDWDARYFDELVFEKWLIDGKDLETALDEADDEYPSMDTWVLWEE